MATALPRETPREVEREQPSLTGLDRAEQLAGTGTWEWDLETDRLLWSDNMFRLLGLEPGEIAPTPAYVVGRIVPEDRQRVARRLQESREKGTPPDVTYRITRLDGCVRVLRACSVAEERDGRPSRLVGSVQDVTELAEAQRATAESLTLVETFQAAAPVGFGFMDRDFRIVRLNQTLAEVNGSPAEDQIGRLVADVVPDVWSQMEPVYRSVLDTGEPVVNLPVERLTGPGKEHRYWLTSYYPVAIEEEVIGIGIIVVDITERAQAELFRAAVMDTMVEGLYVLDADGRLAFMNSAASQILGWTEDELRGRSMHEAIHFQHADGSPHPEEECELLKVRLEGRPVEKSKKAFTRKDGTICPVAYSAAPLQMGTTVSGVVVVFRDTSDEQADELRIQRELDTLAWIGRTRDAIDDDRLTLFSQPIVPLAGGQGSQELLLRMIGKDGEVIAPGCFLPVAERYGLIAEIDRWVIRQAARLAAHGQRIEANLSTESISDPDLLSFITQELGNTGADPANLIFEITETALMKDLAAGEAFAHGLSEIGCRVALDDFGTGFGSFTYLKKLRITYLKIDIDFVQDLVTNKASQHLVKAIVGLAQDFGYETIAEGVENAETLELIRNYGVDYAQGFHLGRPRAIDLRARASSALPVSVRK